MASSWTLRQSRLRDGVAGLMADADEEVVREVGVGALTEERSDAVGARRTIFFDESAVKDMEGSAKGGLRMPSLGVIMNF